MQVILIRSCEYYLGIIFFVIMSPVLNQNIVFKTLKSADAMYSYIKNVND